MIVQRRSPFALGVDQIQFQTNAIRRVNDADRHNGQISKFVVWGAHVQSSYTDLHSRHHHRLPP